jgi:hypothetical protein
MTDINTFSPCTIYKDVNGLDDTLPINVLCAIYSSDYHTNTARFNLYNALRKDGMDDETIIEILAL